MNKKSKTFAWILKCRSHANGDKKCFPYHEEAKRSISKHISPGTHLNKRSKLEINQLDLTASTISGQPSNVHVVGSLVLPPLFLAQLLRL